MSLAKSALPFVAPGRRRPTIGFLLNDSLLDAYTRGIWEGAVEGARALGINLVCFVGDRTDRSESLPHNLTLLSQIRPGTIDGLLTMNLSDRAVLDRIPAFRKVPCASVQPTSDVASVIADNYGGMRAAIEHLIEVHRCRQIAFVRGTRGDVAADERYRAWVEALEEHKMPRDPALVFQGRFLPEDGTAAVRAFLDERRLSIDALVAANDEMALAALGALHARGHVAPQDVAVVGFDNIERAGLATPPLTTVFQPLPKMAHRALEIVLQQIEGQGPPDGHETLPAQLLVRRSCGCFPESVIRAAAQAPERKRGQKSTATTLGSAVARKRVAAQIEERVVAFASGPKAGWAAPLVEALARDLASKTPGEFLLAMERLIRNCAAQELPVNSLQDVISELRRQTLPMITARPAQLATADNLWNQARVLVDEAGQRQFQVRQVEAERRHAALRRVSSALGSTFDVEGIAELLARESPSLGLSHCYLALHEGQEKPPERSRLVLAYRDGERSTLEREGLPLPTNALIPSELWPIHDRFTVQVLPVFFSVEEDEELGFIVVGGEEADADLCETLRAQMRSALKGAMALRQRDANQRALQQEVDVRRSAEDEARNYAEKLAQSNVELLERQEALTKENEERRRAEAAASRERDLLHALMDNIPDLIYFKDRQSRFTRINRAQAEALRVADPQDAEGHSEADFMPHDFARASADDEREIFATGNPVIGKMQQETRSGRWYLVTKVPIRNAQGLVGLVGVSRDITERRQAEERLARDLEAFRGMLDAAAQGDLTRQVTVDDAAVGLMATAVDGMLRRFSTLLSEVRDAAFAVSASSEEILAASTQISKAAQYGRDQVHNTSSAVEEMAKSMSQVSRSAEVSETKAHQVLEHVRQGDDAVNVSYVGMERIDTAVGDAAAKLRLLEARSKEISEIIDLIDEIASQSKLLALNAAIEAAHAGDAGRGFAVVAEEVRRLADNSTQATKDISRRVEGITAETTAALTAMENAMREVRAGRDLSSQARGSLQGIRALAEDSARISVEIANASREQAQATQTVASAMETLSNISVESAAGATESSKAVRDLVRLSTHLNEAISRFKL